MSDVFDQTFVEVYSKTTGQKQTVPRDWLASEVLGADFSLTPTARARELVDVETGTPDQAWTPAQLRDFAKRNDISVKGLRKKADLLAAVLAGPTDTTTDPSSTDETPASGDEE